MKRTLQVLLIIGFIYSCSSSSGLFKKESPHEVYGKMLQDAGLDQTVLGQQWFDAARRSIEQPVSISIPYKQVGYFSAEKPTAVGLKFSVQRGQKLLFQFIQNPDTGFRLYADLWKIQGNENPKRVLFADTSKTNFSYEAEESGDLILRLQPELLASGDYKLNISVGPSLAFPVAGNSARVGSIWDDPRDGGSRRHEGIDIFDKKGTPVLAAADGRISRTGDGGIGGKVVWLRAANKPMSLYYAHLDKQLVEPGQRVKVGDTLGLMGNTGNARTTPPHLHFGIYVMGGAIDPLPFVDRKVKNGADPNLEINKLGKFYRITSDLNTGDENLGRHSIVWAIAGDNKAFIASLPDKGIVKIARDIVQPIDNQLYAKRIKDSAVLFDQPATVAGIKIALAPETIVKVKGYYKNFAFVEAESGETGWIQEPFIK